MKFVSADLPRRNLAEEDSYGGGGVKKSAAGASTSATSSRGDDYGHQRGSAYGMQARKQRGGRGAAAHSGLGGLDGELGDALRSTVQRWGSTASGDEDDGDGGAPGLPALRGSTER